MGQIVIDRNKLSAVLADVYVGYRAGEGVYQFITRDRFAPQYAHVPASLTRGSNQDYLRWLFVATLTDRRTVSFQNYRGHVKIYEEFPGLYSYDTLVAELTCRGRQFLHETFRNNGVGMPGQSSVYAPQVLKTLRDDFENNPLLIFEETIDETIKKLKDNKVKLPGYGPKLLSLYAIYLCELGLISLDDAVPVDVWVQTLLISTNAVLIEGEVSNVTMEKTVRPLISAWCCENNVSPVDLAHAIWLLGSKSCARCEQIAQVNTCPVYNYCGGRVVSWSYFKEGIWRDSDSMVRRSKSLQYSLF